MRARLPPPRAHPDPARRLPLHPLPSVARTKGDRPRTPPPPPTYSGLGDLPHARLSLLFADRLGSPRTPPDCNCIGPGTTELMASSTPSSSAASSNAGADPNTANLRPTSRSCPSFLKKRARGEDGGRRGRREVGEAARAKEKRGKRGDWIMKERGDCDPGSGQRSFHD